MQRLLIRGGRRLVGSVEICGAKNAALPQIAAALLSSAPLTLVNVPDLADIRAMLELIDCYGVTVRRAGNTLELDAANALNVTAPYEIVRKMRATMLVLGPLMARYGAAKVSLPGGCAIGTRPVDLHIKALAALGAEVDVEAGYIVARAPAGGLRGGRIFFPTTSVGATATAMMAALGAKGETEIVNAAREPEMQDLADCLVAMGARIEGAGTHRLLIEGGRSLHAARHEVIPDRMEAGTYAIAAAMTGGQLELCGARLDHMLAVSETLEAAGVRLFPTDRGLMAERIGPLKAVDMTTEPYPGFPTDLQAQFMTLMAIAEGSSVIRETIFENRFMHVPELMRLGANIALSGSTAHVRGGATLTGAPVMATDLRASVSLVLAGLVASGETIVDRIYHLDRGYEALDVKLRRCGADVERLAS